MSNYAEVWKQIKQSEEDQWVWLTVPSVSRFQTITHRLENIKSKEQAYRREHGLPLLGKLKVWRKPAEKRIGFCLVGNGSLI